LVDVLLVAALVVLLVAAYAFFASLPREAHG
jgi:hypothetical protein